MEPSGSESFFIYFRASRKSITASPAAITRPATLAHIGTAIPLTVTSQPKNTLRIALIGIYRRLIEDAYRSETRMDIWLQGGGFASETRGVRRKSLEGGRARELIRDP